MSCAFEPRLSLLLYPGELSLGDEELVREHLATCPACQAMFEELEATSSFLDAAPIELPDALQGELKERVLAAVGHLPSCPHEEDLILGGDPHHLQDCPSCSEAQRAFGQVEGALRHVPVPALSPDAAEALRGRILTAVGQAPCAFEAELPWLSAAERGEHLAECASCAVADAEFALVGQALDRVSVPPPDPIRWAELRARVASEVAAPTVKTGRVIGFPAALVRLAAAVLFATTLGLTGYTVMDRPGVVPAQLTRMELEADILVRTGEETALTQAMQRYTRLSSAPDARVASRARYEALGLRALQSRKRAGAASVAPAAVYPSKDPVKRRLQQQTRARDMLVSYQDVLIEFPGTRASLFAIKKALPREEQYSWIDESPLRDFQPKIKRYGLDKVKPYNAAHQRRLEHLLAQRTKVMRWDYTSMRKLGKLVVDPNLFNDPRLRQSILLQRALHAEELTAVASSDVERDRLREEAVKDLRDVIELAPKTKAADLARQVLARI